MPSRTGVRDACQKMDTCMEIAVEVLPRFSDFYIKNKQLQKSKIVVSEMGKIEDEFYTAYEKAQGYLFLFLWYVFSRTAGSVDKVIHYIFTTIFITF